MLTRREEMYQKSSRRQSMKTKIVKNYVYVGLGFPIELEKWK
jgi:hypothetical protein